MKWLHLSDLHIIKKVNWEVFIKDLLQRCEERGKIDLVIVTGDFHEFKEKDDFSKAKIFLIDLIEKLKLDITKDLFLIPGDHDGSNPICDHKDGNIAVLKKDVTRINGKEWNELLEQFESYENFVKELIPKYPFEHPAGEHCRTWNDKITFIHCNSAVVSDLIDEKEQLLNIDTFANLAMESRLPSIVLMHNHISDIHKEQVGQIKGIIRNSKIKAFFCGAHHKQQMDMINVSDKQNCQIPCVGCYKSAPDAEDRYSTCGVIIGTWINEKATLEGWTWKVDRSFKLDNIISGQTIEMGEKYYNEASKYVEGKVLLRNHKFSNVVLCQDLVQVKMRNFSPILTCQKLSLSVRSFIHSFEFVWRHIVAMAMNSFRIVESFQIFKNQLVCLLIITDFKAIEPFTFDNRMKGFNACIIPRKSFLRITALHIFGCFFIFLCNILAATIRMDN